MPAKPTLESPGVQIREVDLSLRPVATAATTILIPGFSQRGPAEDAIKVASMSEFETIYGPPSNAAERYFYYTVKAAFQSPADILVTRLPYGSGGGNTVVDDYVGVLAYPATFFSNGATATDLSTQTFSQSAGTYVLGAPRHYQLTKQQFTNFLNGSLFTNGYSNTCLAPLGSDIQSLSSAALIIANQSQTVINNLYEGYYIGIADNTNENDATAFDSIIGVKSLNSSSSYVAPTDYQVVSNTRLANGVESLSAPHDGASGSLSETLETKVASFSLYTSAFSDTIKIGLFKLRQSVFSNNSIELTWGLEEGYAGSFDSQRVENSSGGGPASNFSIENVTRNSSNIVVKVNPYLSRTVSGVGYQGQDGIPNVRIRVANTTLLGSASATDFLGLTTSATMSAISRYGNANAIFPLGVYSSSDQSTKNCGNIPAKLTRIFDTLKNNDIYPFDIACEAGLGTVYACSSANNGIFDDFRYLNVNSLSASNGSVPASPPRDAHRGVYNAFIDLAEDPNRRDFLFISDPLIPIFVQANSIKTLDDPSMSNTFSTSILWSMINLYNTADTSYAVTYPTCVKINDFVTGRDVWVPFSGIAAATMATMDVTDYPWSTPAGFTRGIVKGALDLAIYPKQKERDQFYKAGFNSVAFFPGDGFIIYGQRTLLKRPSAFDRINVRRLFLSLEKATRNTLKYFVFEPNTLLTRTKVVNTLTPIFEYAKNTQGIYDYMIICDERNNTPETIDANALVVDIYVKAVRTAEFILANFYATRTGVNFQEIAG